MITIYDELEQGSDEWLQARAGILTASVIGKLISPTLKVANNDTSRATTLTLAVERITGHVEYMHPTFDMQRGTDDEPFARDMYAEHHAPVTEVGFMVREEPWFKVGYSPDGLVGDDGLIEIKSRKPHVQMATILNNEVPAANMAQLQAGLFVTGRQWIDYISYAQGMPLYVKRVHPDLAWFMAIQAVAAAFEKDVAALEVDFKTVTTGLPVAERRPDYQEVELKL